MNVHFAQSSVLPRDKPFIENRQNAKSLKQKFVLCGSDWLWDTSSRKYIYIKHKTQTLWTRFSPVFLWCHWILPRRVLQENIRFNIGQFHYSCWSILPQIFLEAWTCKKWSWQCQEQYWNKVNELIHLALEELDSRINIGMGFTLAEITEYMSSLDNDPEPFILYNCDVKKLLQGHYGNEIQFALNSQ